VLTSLVPRILVIAAVVPAAAESIYQSQEDWEVTESPESLGLDAKQLDELTAELEASVATSMLATVGDDLLFHYGDSDQVSYVASVRKSILAMLYGPFVTDGTIDLDTSLEELEFDDVRGLLPIEQRATIRHLVTARSGIYHPASNEGDSREHAPERGSQEPGTYFLYNNWDFNAAGAVLEQLTGEDIYDIYQEVLAEPLGFQDFRRRMHQKMGDATLSKHLSYPFLMSTRDMARVGYLMLRDGEWFGEQVVDADWVERIRTTVTPLDRMNPPDFRKLGLEYAYMWWVYRGDNARLEGSYFAMGAWGQYISVLPEQDMVIAFKTNPSLLERLKHEGNEDAISISLQEYLEFVRRLLDARIPR